MFVFGKFGMLCFLVTPVLRFILLPYYQQIVDNYLIPIIFFQNFSTIYLIKYLGLTSYYFKNMKIILSYFVMFVILLWILDFKASLDVQTYDWRIRSW